MDIFDIDMINNSFSCKIRMFLFWVTDLLDPTFNDLTRKARESGHNYVLSEEETERFCEAYRIPSVAFFNAFETTDDAPLPGVRIFSGDKGRTAVMWTKPFTVKFRKVFELQRFPFDTQKLMIELRLNDARTWDSYDLTTNIIQFHRQALKLDEYQQLPPRVDRDVPKNRVSQVKIRLNRLSYYYTQNIVIVMSSLSLLGLLTFTLDADALADRIGIMFQLILTAVAFKFVLASMLSRVSYNTVIDSYISVSFASLVLTTVIAVLPNFFEYQDWANRLAFVTSALLVTGTIMPWVYMVSSGSKRLSSSRTEDSPIVLQDEKVWYTFRFSLPHYLGD